MLTYGCVVWVKATASAGVQRSLERIQRLALTSLGHFRLNTPTAGLEIITHTIPLWLFIQQEAAAAHAAAQEAAAAQACAQEAAAAQAARAEAERQQMIAAQQVWSLTILICWLFRI